MLSCYIFKATIIWRRITRAPEIVCIFKFFSTKNSILLFIIFIEKQITIKIDYDRIPLQPDINIVVKNNEFPLYVVQFFRFKEEKIKFGFIFHM